LSCSTGASYAANTGTKSTVIRTGATVPIGRAAETGRAGGSSAGASLSAFERCKERVRKGDNWREDEKDEGKPCRDHFRRAGFVIWGMGLVENIRLGAKVLYGL